MSKKTRTIILAASVVAVVGIVTAVAFFAASRATLLDAPGLSDSTNSGNGLSSDFEPGFYPDGENKQAVEGMAISVNGMEIDFDEYRYYFQYMRDVFANYYGMEFFEDEENLEMFKEEIETELKYFAFFTELAKELDTNLTDEELAEALQISEEDFEEQGMAEYFTDYDVYVRVASSNTLCNKAVNDWYEKGITDNKSEAEAEFEKERAAHVSAEHILIKIDETAIDIDEDSLDIDVADDASEEEIELAKQEALEQATAAARQELVEELEKTANDIYAQIAASDNAYAKFTELREKYNEDTGQPEKGYSFGEGEMMTEFYDAALATEIDEFSEPVLVDGWYTGFHIIYRHPLDEQHAEEWVENQAMIIAQTALQKRVEEALESYDVSYGSYYNDINFVSVK